MRTSLTVTAEYRDFCKLAADNPAVFKTFRRQPEYSHVVAVHPDDGRRYLERLEVWPERAEDATGSPLMFEAERVMLDPVMVRYHHDRQEIWRRFGPTSDMRIVEIGGGFGGLARLVAPFCESYAICDLPEVRALQDVYLARFDVQVDDAEPGDYDLVISTFAFSELVPDVQRQYAEDYLCGSPRGWMICNFLAEGLGPAELLDLVPGARWEPEVPRTHPLNRVLVWGDE